MAVTLGRILLIEDEQIFARAVARRLERAGYTCRVVGTIKEGQLAFDDLAPELLLLDMCLPDSSGLDLLERLTGTVPVIVMTAYGEVEDAVSAMKLSASDYLKKPIDLEELLLAVQKVRAPAKMWWRDYCTNNRGVAQSHLCTSIARLCPKIWSRPNCSAMYKGLLSTQILSASD
jgi:DNA-binding response OmpR family regulator